MTELNSVHRNELISAQTHLPVVEKSKAAYRDWVIMHRNIPRTERFGIGMRVDALFLDLLELLRRATYASVSQKAAILEECLSKTDGLRFFIQVMWETKLISDDKFTALGGSVENIGKMIGGWKKGLLTKTPATKAGERK